MTAIDVGCTGDSSRGWTCTVSLRDGDHAVSAHEVGVQPADLERLAPGAGDPSDLVERSFAFLLERESSASILRTFDLSVIGHYFPEYESLIATGRPTA